MTDHRVLVSSETHEPKHISDTTSVDAGKVITPLSGGTSELRNLTPSEVGISLMYGEAALDANTTGFATTAASDPTLYSTADYIQLNSIREPAVYLDHNNGISFNPTTNALIPSISGDYRINFWMNVIADVNNSKIGIKVKENGEWANITAKHDLPSIGRVQIVAGSLITDLLAGNEVTLWVACDKSATVTIQDMRFYIELLREV